jgi:hypothetical protein
VEGDLLRPLLVRYPDASKARVRLLQPVLFPYVALIFGSMIASLLAAYNAIVLRKYLAATGCFAQGLAGWCLAVMILVSAARAGVPNLALVLLAVRVFHFLMGAWMFQRQRPRVTGHTFLGGRMVPLLGSYMTAFALGILVPWRVILFLLGLPDV